MDIAGPRAIWEAGDAVRFFLAGHGAVEEQGGRVGAFAKGDEEEGEYEGDQYD